MMAAAFVSNFLFWSGLSIGGVVLAALVEVSGGEWLGPMRDTAERLRRFLPFSFVLFALLMWRSADVYPWARDAGGFWWMRPWLVALRDGLALAAVYASAFGYCRASHRTIASQRRGAAHRAAVTFLIVYAVGFSVVAIDLIMSLDPRWSSTLFPAYVFTGNVCAGTAAVATWTAWRSDADRDSRRPARMRDAANLLVGFALFWMYLFWSQFLVIWYGNLSGEVTFMMARIGTARPLGWVILAACWAAPAVAFVPQWGKRIGVLRAVGVVMLIGCWLERWLLIAPGLPGSSAVAAILVTGLFAALFAASMRWPAE